MVFVRIVCGLVVGLSVSTTAMAATQKATSLRDQQQAACYDDAQRLCGDAMPDVDKVIECMKPKKALVSAACAAFYK